MAIEVKNISKKFHKAKVVDNISFKIGDGELVALIGPSGSGKTTLLRIIGGLEFADSGTILMDDIETQNISVKERNVGFVFQNYVLFKHMSVFNNVAFGLKVKPFKTRPPHKKIKENVIKLLKLVHLEKFQDYYPHQLSGGQQQRVALARALAINPKVLLLDEPFGAIDTKVRKELAQWVRRLHDEIEISSLFVTHDQEEAMEIADKVGVINKGKLVQFGPPEEILKQPVNHFVYDFIGTHNEFPAWIDHQEKIHLLPDLLDEPKNKKIVKLCCRPYEIHLSKKETPDAVEAKVLHYNNAGNLIKIELKRKTAEIIYVEMPINEFNELQLKRNETVFVKPLKFKIFES